MAQPSFYRAAHQLRKGGLHRALNLPDGDIPADRLEKANGSKNLHVATMARIHAAKNKKKD